MEKYSDELREFVYDELREYLIYFGYAKNEESDSAVGFHDLGPLSEDEKLNYQHFKEVNQIS